MYDKKLFVRDFFSYPTQAFGGHAKIRSDVIVLYHLLDEWVGLNKRSVSLCS